MHNTKIKKIQSEVRTCIRLSKVKATERHWQIVFARWTAKALCFSWTWASRVIHAFVWMIHVGLSHGTETWISKCFSVVRVILVQWPWTQQCRGWALSKIFCTHPRTHEFSAVVSAPFNCHGHCTDWHAFESPKIFMQEFSWDMYPLTYDCRHASHGMHSTLRD